MPEKNPTLEEFAPEKPDLATVNLSESDISDLSKGRLSEEKQREIEKALEEGKEKSEAIRRYEISLVSQTRKLLTYIERMIVSRASSYGSSFSSEIYKKFFLSVDKAIVLDGENTMWTDGKRICISPKFVFEQIRKELGETATFEGMRDMTYACVVHEILHMMFHFMDSDFLKASKDSDDGVQLASRIKIPFENEPAGVAIHEFENMALDYVVNDIIEHDIPEKLPSFGLHFGRDLTHEDKMNPDTAKIIRRVESMIGKNAEPRYVGEERLLLVLLTAASELYAEKLGLDFSPARTLNESMYLFRNLYNKYAEKMKDKDPDHDGEPGHDEEPGKEGKGKGGAGKGNPPQKKPGKDSASDGSKNSKDSDKDEKQDGKGSGKNEKDDGEKDKDDKGSSEGDDNKNEKGKNDDSDSVGDGSWKGNKNDEKNSKGKNAPENDILQKVIDAVGKGRSFDNHDKSEEEMSKRAVEHPTVDDRKDWQDLAERITQDQINGLSETDRKNIGSGSVLGGILLRMSTKQPSVVAKPWFQALRSALSSEVVNRYDERRERVPEEEAYGIASSGMGIVSNEYKSSVGRFAFVIDVSGSMSNAEVGTAVSQMLATAQTLRPENSITIVQVDGDVVGWDTYTIGSSKFKQFKRDCAEKGFTRKGSGGTEFGSVFKRIVSAWPKFDSVIVFSDMGIGDLDSLPKPKAPVFWMSYGGGTKVKVPFGTMYETDSLFEEMARKNREAGEMSR